MSRPNWEYASVIWAEALRKITDVDPEFERLPTKTRSEYLQKGWEFCYWRTNTIYIWLPGADESDERVSWETDDETHRVTQLDVLNELGEAGWEVVSIYPMNTAMGPSLGRETTGYVTRTKTFLKRPVE